MEKRCVIISGGEFSPLNDIKPEDFIIACDLGCRHAERLGLKIDIAMGDFDSYSGEISAPEIYRCKPEKDDTDTMMAVRKALELGYKRISLRCALGGRLDHLIANLQTVAFAAEHGAVLDIADERNSVTGLLPGKNLISRRNGFYLSFFALNGPAEGVCIKGAKYPLENYRLTGSFPIGVSNEFEAAQVEISFKNGIIAAVLSKK